jgi:hypothetical protein
LRAIAARLRALVGRVYGTALREAAARLRIAEVDLWYVLRGRAPWPDTDLLAAVCAAAVRHFGLDPVWLVTGDCDPALHRCAEEQSDPTRLRQLVTDLLTGKLDRRLQEAV